MTMHPSDATLVSGHLAGDPSALAGIYDRYADSLHDTAAAMLNDRNEAADVLHDVILIAAERLGQLRDPDRLKPWLFAILRNEVYRRSKKRRRTIATDFSGSDDGYDMADDRHLDPSVDVTDDAAGEDLAELVRNAARGLDDRDQLVLELSVRQGLGGQDLADALGVSANQSYTLVHRMRERVERSLTAYVVAKAGRNDCDDLDQLLAKWDGEFTVLVRKRVARHVDACEVCDTRRSKVAPLAMFASAPVYGAPAALRDRVLDAAIAKGPPPTTPYQFTATDGFPQIVRAARRVAAWVAPTAAASLMLVAAGLGIALMDRGGGDSVITDEAFVAVTSDAVTTTTPVIDPSSTAVLAAEGATNDSVPAVSAAATTTAAPTTIAPTADTTPGAEPAAPKPPPTAAPSTTPSAAPPGTPAPTQAPPPDPPTPTTPAPSPPAPPPPEPATTPPAAPPDTPAATPPPTPGRLTANSSSISLGSGSGASSGSIQLTNLGDLPLTFGVSGDTGAFTVSPRSGTIGGGQTVSITASIDRSGLAEGSDPTASFTVSGDDASIYTISVSAQVDRPPVISGASASSFCSTTFAGISSSASVSDESSVTVSFFVSGPNGQSASDAMSRDGGMWFGAVDFSFSGPNFDDPSSVNGTWSWSMTATDARGNTASTGGSTTVAC